MARREILQAAGASAAGAPAPGRVCLRAGALLALILLGGCSFYDTGEDYAPRTRRGVYHTVRRGESLWRISKAYGVNIEQIAVLNGIDNPDILKAGVKVFIPGAERVRAVSRTGGSGAPRVRPRWAAPRRRKGGSSSARGKRSARGYKSGRSRRSVRAERSARRRVRFAWPVKGRLLRRFGTRRGVKYDGIAIRGPERATVRAAAPGRVIFSDWGPGGLGRTVIIRHAGGNYHSVYAHNSVNLVRAGQQVRRGAPIARLGSSGEAESARLHFEIRYRTKPRNPLTYLP